MPVVIHSLFLFFKVLYRTGKQDSKLMRKVFKKELKAAFTSSCG
jgi:hypothetical protein